MNLERVEKIAEAVLYEGYMLYPYRASAVKNQQRWNFGVLCPRAYSEEQNGSEAWEMQTECLVEVDGKTQLSVKVRFLQIVDRLIGVLTPPLRELPAAGEPEFEWIDRLEVGGDVFAPWQEAREREVVVPSFDPVVSSVHRVVSFEFAAGREFEAIRDGDGRIAGVAVRKWRRLCGRIEVGSEQCRDGVVKVTVRICNSSPHELTQGESRAEALMDSLVSVHTVMGVEGGRFVSLLDPPESLREAAAECRNVGTWPVLAGDEGERDVMLSSPIILYDYPQIAPESPGSLFDGTEIDEILSLRILTMTEEEKDEMRRSDRRAREILERTESMPSEQFMKLHGVLRGLQTSGAAR